MSLRKRCLPSEPVPGSRVGVRQMEEMSQEGPGRPSSVGEDRQTSALPPRNGHNSAPSWPGPTRRLGPSVPIPEPWRPLVPYCPPPCKGAAPHPRRMKRWGEVQLCPLVPGLPAPSHLDNREEVAVCGAPPWTRPCAGCFLKASLI